MTLLKTSLKIISCFLLVLTLAANAADIKQLRGQRYCEIFLGKNNWFSKELHIYNTIGLNNCPENLWSKISEENIKAETNAEFVRLNGPRFWIIDGMQNSKLVDPEEKVFGGIAMRDAGTLEVNILSSKEGQKPYQEHHVERDTTWIYLAKKPIYELISEDGKIYVMQSYSNQKEKITENSLGKLGAKLKLPEGWIFRTRILKKDAGLTPVNKDAVVIQDDYLNTYQLETPNFMRDTDASAEKKS